MAAQRVAQLAAACRQSVDAVVASFSSFRGENAQCFKREDREKMLAIIEASFGDFVFFDAIVRDCLSTHQHASMASLPVKVATDP